MPTRIGSRRFLVVLAAVFATSLNALPASSIQGGTKDTTRPYRYPNVVCVSQHAPTTDIKCGTGSLISPRVVLTAAHVIAFAESEGLAIRVSTDAAVPLDPDTASMIPVVRTATHPLWFRRDGWKHDIGVLILERPIRGVPLAELPAEGLLDELQAQYGSVDKIPGGFTAVGYGFQVDDRGNLIWEDPQYRRYGPAYIDGSPDKWFNLSFKKTAVTPGDSGAPVFLGTSFTLAGVIGGWTRLDTPSARSFLDDFVPVP